MPRNPPKRLSTVLRQWRIISGFFSEQSNLPALGFVVKSKSRNLGPPWVFMGEGFSGNATWGHFPGYLCMWQKRRLNWIFWDQRQIFLQYRYRRRNLESSHSIYQYAFENYVRDFNCTQGSHLRVESETHIILCGLGKLLILVSVYLPIKLQIKRAILQSHENWMMQLVKILNL